MIRLPAGIATLAEPTSARFDMSKTLVVLIALCITAAMIGIGQYHQREMARTTIGQSSK